MLRAKTWYPADDERNASYQLKKAEERAHNNYLYELQRIERLRELRERRDHGMNGGDFFQPRMPVIRNNSLSYASPASIQQVTPQLSAGPPHLGLPAKNNSMSGAGLNGGNNQGIRQTTNNTGGVNQNGNLGSTQLQHNNNNSNSNNQLKGNGMGGGINGNQQTKNQSCSHPECHNLQTGSSVPKMNQGNGNGMGNRMDNTNGNRMMNNGNGMGNGTTNGNGNTNRNSSGNGMGNGMANNNGNTNRNSSGNQQRGVGHDCQSTRARSTSNPHSIPQNHPSGKMSCRPNGGCNCSSINRNLSHDDWSHHPANFSNNVNTYTDDGCSRPRPIAIPQKTGFSGNNFHSTNHSPSDYSEYESPPLRGGITKSWTGDGFRNLRSGLPIRGKSYSPSLSRHLTYCDDDRFLSWDERKELRRAIQEEQDELRKLLRDEKRTSYNSSRRSSVSFI